MHGVGGRRRRIIASANEGVAAEARLHDEVHVIAAAESHEATTSHAWQNQLTTLKKGIGTIDVSGRRSGCCPVDQYR